VHSPAAPPALFPAVALLGQLPVAGSLTTSLSARRPVQGWHRHAAAVRGTMRCPYPAPAAAANGQVVGLLPLYGKRHSHADFIHDWARAAAWRQVGSAYYPKLTVMTVEKPLMMKVMTASLMPGPSPAPGRREIRESLTRLSD